MAAHVYRVQVGWVAANKNFGMNVFHYQMDDSLFSSEWAAAQALANAFVTTIIPLISNMQSNDVTINIVTARRIDGGGGLSASSVVNVTGNQPGPTISSVLAACFKWITADPDNRPGRTFVGGVVGAAISDETWQAAFLTPALTFIAAMTVNLAVGLANAVFGKYDRKSATFFPITDGQLNPKPSGFNKRSLPVT